MSAAAMRLGPALTVFISHGCEDRHLAQRIERSLNFGGRGRVQTGRMVGCGEDWREEWRRASASSDVFLVIGAPASANSESVLLELGGAWALGKPIVVVVPEGQVPWAAPIDRSAYQHVALADLEQPAFAESLLTELTAPVDG
jgi:hypothetical protein